MVAGLAIPAPLLLPGMHHGASVVIECSLSLANGSIEATSLAPGSGSRQVHVTATAATLCRASAATATPSTTPNAASRAALLRPAAAPLTAAAVAVLPTTTGRSATWLDPAAYDCFLQLGQALKAVGDTEVYVPAGLAALRAAAAASCSAWAATVPLPAGAGVLSSDFHLAADSSPAQLCSISALTAKPMRRAPAGAAATVATVQLTDCLYELTWQAAETPDAAAQPAAAAGAAALWQLSASEQRQPAASAAGAIGAVQRLLKGGTGSAAAVRLQTVGAALLPMCGSAGSCSNTAAASALSGLVKTLSQEAPQLRWVSSDVDGQTPATLPSGTAALIHLPAGAPAGDAFGSADRGGARWTPLLLKSAAVEQAGPYHLFPQPRGSLGSLAALPVDTGRRLGPEEVVIEVKSVGINFRWAQWPPSFDAEPAPLPIVYTFLTPTPASTTQGRAQCAGHVPW